MLAMLAGGVPIARLFGLEIRVHLSWVLILALVTIGVGNQLGVRHPAWPAELLWIASGAVSLLFFASVAVHELAHGVVAERRGLGGGVVMLLFFGGTTQPGRDAQRPADEAAVAGAGPVASFGIAALCIAVWQLAARTIGSAGSAVGSGTSGSHDFGDAVAESAFVLAALNVLLAVINLLPVFPLDGGRLLRAALWQRFGDERRANRAVGIVGRYVGLLMVGAGFVIALMGNVGDGLLLGISGWFLTSAARALDRRAALEAMLSGVRVDAVMDRDLPSVAPQLTLDTFAAQYLRGGETTSLPVVSDESLVGLIGVSQLRRVPRRSWPTTRAGDVMVQRADDPDARSGGRALAGGRAPATDWPRRPAGDAGPGAAGCPHPTERRDGDPGADARRGDADVTAAAVPGIGGPADPSGAASDRLLTVEEALAQVLAAVGEPLPAEPLATAEALGRVLASPARARDRAAAVGQQRDGRLRDPGGRHGSARRTTAPRRLTRGRRRGGRCGADDGRGPTAPPSGSRPARRCRRVPMRSCPSN